MHTVEPIQEEYHKHKDWFQHLHSQISCGSEKVRETSLKGQKPFLNTTSKIFALNVTEEKHTFQLSN